MPEKYEILNEILENLKNIKFNDNVLENEDALEKFLLSEIRPIAKKYMKNIQTQPKMIRERVQKADISIGLGEILIEIKLLENINDIYRLFYQAVKYLKNAQKALILFVYDKNNVLKEEDKEDLKALERPPKTLKIIVRRK